MQSTDIARSNTAIIISSAIVQESTDGVLTAETGTSGAHEAEAVVVASAVHEACFTPLRLTGRRARAVLADAAWGTDVSALAAVVGVCVEVCGTGWGGGDGYGGGESRVSVSEGEHNI
jgi:hypothetical protein